MKVYLDTIGCRLNQAEIEKMAAQLRRAGHILVDIPQSADVVIINTCSVTLEAASDSRQKIRQAIRAGAEKVIVTGCWATLEPEAAALLPGVNWVVTNPDKDRLIADLLHIEPKEFDLEPLARQPIPGEHLRTRAFVMVQDGCDNFCTFCITRIARGAGRSRPVEEVLKDIHSALAGGTQEIVLTGVNLGSWGQDFDSTRHLSYLIETILSQTAVSRLRLSSLEPWDLEEAFFDLWKDHRMCRHLHLPLQSGSSRVLRQMARKTTPLNYSGLVEMARKACPQIAITTDLIVGFPGETEEDFSEGLEFVRKMSFAGGHVFSYSSRPGTAAARLPNQVPVALRKQRSKTMRAVIDDSALIYRRQFVGTETTVLWEAGEIQDNNGWHLNGLTDNYLKVNAFSTERLWNQFSQVRLESLTSQGLSGTILNHRSWG